MPVRFVLMDTLQALSMPLFFSKWKLLHMGVQTFLLFKALKWIVRYSSICSPVFKTKNGPCKTGQRLIILYLACEILVKIFVQ